MSQTRLIQLQRRSRKTMGMIVAVQRVKVTYTGEYLGVAPSTTTHMFFLCLHEMNFQANAWGGSGNSPVCRDTLRRY